MRRAGPKSSKKRKGSGSGILQTFAGPLGMVVLGLLLVLGVGYYVNRSLGTAKPASTVPVKTPKDESKPTLGTPQPTPQPTPPVTTPPPAPAKTEPPKVDPNAATLKARAHVDRSAGAAKTTKLVIYYADGLKNAESLQPVEVLLPYTVSPIKLAAEQIIKEPAELKLFGSLPAGTKVLGAKMSNGVATVDLSAEAARVQGSASVNNIMASFVYTLTEIPDVKAVQLWINGFPAQLHGVLWDKPLSRAQLVQRNLFKVEPVIKYEAKP